MLDAQEFIDCLRKNAVECFTEVPDSLVKERVSKVRKLRPYFLEQWGPRFGGW